MRKLMMIAGAAALAISVPVFAEGQGRGNDRGAEQKGRGNQDRGRGGDRAKERGRGGDRAEGRRELRREARQGRGEARREVRQDQREAGQRQRERVREARQDRRERVREARQDRREAIREARQERRAFDRDRRRDLREARRDLRDDRRQRLRDAREDRRDWRRWVDRSPLRILPDERDVEPRRWRDRPRRVVGWRGDCPPGLARQNAWCLPPGQLRRLQGQSYNVPERFRYRFADGGDHLWRYDDAGYVYRIDRGDGLIEQIVPLAATDLFVGAPLPLGYEVYNVPLAYRSAYPYDDGDYHYRYDDGAIYRADRETGLIEAVVALLTGGVGGLGGLGIGDLLPAGYDVYNVPFDHRDDYADRDDAWYRYADGAIYEVDPQTRLIEQIISLAA